jgi:hypothetical protein
VEGGQDLKTAKNNKLKISQRSKVLPEELKGPKLHTKLPEFHKTQKVHYRIYKRP